jgi:predicted nucleic acid-binding protein
MIYALDSNIISFMLKGNETVYSRYFEALSRGNCCVVPLMVYYEVRRGLIANGAIMKMRSFSSLCEDLGVDSLTVADMDTAAEIYADRKHRGLAIDDADLLIAAQAITRGYILVTNNTRHFIGIERLQMEDWAE